MVKKPIRREVRDVTVGDVRIRAVETSGRSTGPGTPPALLLIHDLMVSHSEWDDVVDELASEFHVVAQDLPGFGESAKPSPSRYDYGFATLAESMADLLAGLSLGRVHVMGHGLGGAVAMTLAAQHPELVDRVVLIAPTAFPAPLPFRSRLALYPVIGPFVFKQLYGRGLFRSYFREQVYAHRDRMNVERIDALYDQFNGPAARESAYATMRAMLDTRTLVALFGRVRARCLVVWGRDDGIYPAAFATKLARQLPDARLEVMDAGHSPPEEAPEELCRHVLEFLLGRR
jgi:pimeloyl-ACP methyl ester carboxylesterase